MELMSLMKATASEGADWHTSVVTLSGCAVNVTFSCEKV
jgi:hypothetical protein